MNPVFIIRSAVAFPFILGGLIVFSLGLFILNGATFASDVLRRFRLALPGARD